MSYDPEGRSRPQPGIGDTAQVRDPSARSRFDRWRVGLTLRRRSLQLRRVVRRDAASGSPRLEPADVHPKVRCLTDRPLRLPRPKSRSSPRSAAGHVEQQRHPLGKPNEGAVSRRPLQGVPPDRWAEALPSCGFQHPGQPKLRSGGPAAPGSQSGRAWAHRSEPALMGFALPLPSGRPEPRDEHGERCVPFRPHSASRSHRSGSVLRLKSEAAGAEIGRAHV